MPISEYIVKQRNEGLVLAKKVGAVCAYVLLFALLCFLILALSPELLYIPFFLMSIALVAVVVFVTWRFLCKEFEIVIGNGEMCISTIYARSLTRRLVAVEIKAFSEIGEYDDAAYERLCSMGLQKNFICVSSLSAPRMYYAIYEDGKERAVIYFETDERGLSILKQQNPIAFRAGKTNK